MRILQSLSVCILLLSMCIAQAGQKSTFKITELSVAGQHAYHKLQKTDIFRLGGVGYAGETSLEESSLRTLLKEDVAVDAFMSLVNSGTPEGSLYGLLGLRLKAVKEYRNAVEFLKSKEGPPERSSFLGGMSRRAEVVAKGEVVIQDGCTVSYEKMKKLIAAIDAGNYDQMLK